MENKLLQIQTQLKAPKDLDNKFANYKYRSCESILEALKPLLKIHNCLLTISDDMVTLGNRFYVKAVVVLCDLENKVSYTSSAFAREEEVKKGMDSSQITGAASSYARKYALNGLFLIDDTKDSDHTNTGGYKEESTKPHTPPQRKSETTPGPEGIKTATGFIIDRRAPNKGGFVAFMLEGHINENGKPTQFSTKDDLIIETLDEHRAKGERVCVEYTENANPAFANSITGLVAVKEEVEDAQEV